MQDSRRAAGLLLPDVSRLGSERAQGPIIAGEWQAGRQAAEGKKGDETMSLYKRVTCTKGGTCNTKGASGTCSKCGEQPMGGAWWYRFRFGGRMVHESAKTQSKTVAREVERQRRRGFEEKYNKIEKRTLPPRFEQAAVAWLEGEKPHLAERTHDIYHVAPRCHLIPAMGSWLLCDIEGDEIKAYQAKRKAQGASARTLAVGAGHSALSASSRLSEARSRNK